MSQKFRKIPYRKLIKLKSTTKEQHLAVWYATWRAYRTVPHFRSFVLASFSALLLCKIDVYGWSLRARVRRLFNRPECETTSAVSSSQTCDCRRFMRRLVGPLTPPTTRVAPRSNIKTSKNESHGDDAPPPQPPLVSRRLLQLLRSPRSRRSTGYNKLPSWAWTTSQTAIDVWPGTTIMTTSTIYNQFRCLSLSVDCLASVISRLLQCYNFWLKLYKKIGVIVLIVFFYFNRDNHWKIQAA